MRYHLPTVVLLEFRRCPDGEVRICHQFDHHSLFIFFWVLGWPMTAVSEGLLRPLAGRVLATLGWAADAVSETWGGGFGGSCCQGKVLLLLLKQLGNHLQQCCLSSVCFVMDCQQEALLSRRAASLLLWCWQHHMQPHLQRRSVLLPSYCWHCAVSQDYAVRRRISAALIQFKSCCRDLQNAESLFSLTWGLLHTAVQQVVSNNSYGSMSWVQMECRLKSMS